MTFQNLVKTEIFAFRVRLHVWVFKKMDLRLCLCVLTKYLLEEKSQQNKNLYLNSANIIRQPEVAHLKSLASVTYFRLPPVPLLTSLDRELQEAPKDRTSWK